MPFESLYLFNRSTELRTAAARNGRRGPFLRRGCEIIIGLNQAFPVIKLGIYLISINNREAEHADIFQGVTTGDPISLNGRDMFYPIRLMDYAADLNPSILSIADTENLQRVPRNRVNTVLEHICFEGSAKFHRCDRRTDSEPSTRSWFLPNYYILFKKDREVDRSWVVYRGQTGPGGRITQKYFGRKIEIINKIIGSKVKVTDKGLFKSLKFKNKPGKVVCTIPHASLISTCKESLLKAVIVEFDEDVGGYSMDGKYRKGSCLVVPPGKVEKVKGG